MSVFSERLKSAMKKSNITQAELSSVTGIPKSALSQYLSDKFKPRRERIYILSRELNVSPAWLIGYDDTEVSRTQGKKVYLNEVEYKLIQIYRTSTNFRAKVDAELLSEDASFEVTYGVFRAAKSKNGMQAPSQEKLSAERLLRLVKAPDTDEDI